MNAVRKKFDKREYNREYCRQYFKRAKALRSRELMFTLCPFCESMVLRAEFAEHENIHRKEQPELYDWIDSKFGA